MVTSDAFTTDKDRPSPNEQDIDATQVASTLSERDHTRGVQMHATFWHLIHFAVTAMLCILWAPGDLVAVFQVHTALLHGDRSDDEAESTPMHGPFDDAPAAPREGNAGRARVRTKSEHPFK